MPQYFGYGSNLSVPRLQARIDSAMPLGIAQLRDFRLCFHKPSQDGSGKCDIRPHPGSVVWGMLYELAEPDWQILDAIEGLGKGYQRIDVQLEQASGGCSAVAYQATAMDETLRPYHWYLHHVVYGAEQAALPKDYLAALAAVRAVEDPDIERSASEMSIYV